MQISEAKGKGREGYSGRTEEHRSVQLVCFLRFALTLNRFCLLTFSEHNFKGSISQVFNPYLTIYIAQQDKKIGNWSPFAIPTLSLLIVCNVQVKRWRRSSERRRGTSPTMITKCWARGTIVFAKERDCLSLILKCLCNLCSTDMVYYFYAVMKQAQQLSTSQPFFELYKLFKKYEKKYASVIDNKLTRYTSDKLYVTLGMTLMRM